jgi:hypothetical protein
VIPAHDANPKGSHFRKGHVSAFTTRSARNRTRPDLVHRVSFVPPAFVENIFSSNRKIQSSDLGRMPPGNRQNHPHGFVHPICPDHTSLLGRRRFDVGCLIKDLECDRRLDKKVDSRDAVYVTPALASRPPNRTFGTPTGYFVARYLLQQPIMHNLPTCRRA